MSAGDYRIAATWANLKADTNPLLAEPHPTEYHEGTVTGNSESGFPIELGNPWTLWKYENQILPAAAWDQLRDFVNEAGYAQIYVQTRTNQITIAGHFTYSRFKGWMKTPSGLCAPPWRYREVEVEFFGLVAWSDELEGP